MGRGKDTVSFSDGDIVCRHFPGIYRLSTGALVNCSSDIAVKDLDGKSKLIKNSLVRIRSAFLLLVRVS